MCGQPEAASIAPPSKSVGRVVVNWTRYILAAAIVIWGLLSVVPNPVREVVDECSTVVRVGTSGNPPVNGNETTTTCKRPGVTTLLPYIIGAVIFVLPDFGELAIPGILSLKRKVQEQEGKLAQQELRQELLTANLQTVANQVSTRVDLHLNEVDRSIASKASMLEYDTQPKNDGSLIGLLTDTRTALLQDLAETASKLKRLFDHGLNPTTLPDDERRRIVKWSSVFQSEIRQLLTDADRATQNPFSLELEQLQALLTSMKRLTSVASANC